VAAELIGLGFAALDHLMLVESFKAPVKSMRVKAFDVQGGGMTASALVAAARLGVEGEIWTVAGNGPIGDRIVQGLREEKLNVECVRRASDSDGPLILVFVDEQTGERRFQGARWPKTEGPYPLDLERLDGARCLLVDGIWPKAAAEAARHARSRGVRVVADLSGVGGQNGRLVAEIDCLIVDENCGRQVAGGDEPEKACRLLMDMGPDAVVVTLGERGCVFADAAGVRRRAAFQVEVIDTTGAGDCFHGAFCAALVQGRTFDEAVELASAAAAMNCRSLGGRAGLPGMRELKAFLDGRER